MAAGGARKREFAPKDGAEQKAAAVAAADSSANCGRRRVFSLRRRQQCANYRSAAITKASAHPGKPAARLQAVCAI